MSLTLAAWLALLALFTVLSLRRPSWGIGVYMLTFFAFPGFWWWGRPIAHYRWSLIGGWIALVAVLISLASRRQASANGQPRLVGIARWAAVGILLNATFVHLLLADRPDIGSDAYWDLAKFVLLFFLITAACRSRDDLRIVLLSIVLGAGYIGYEATINDRGNIEGGRLEGIGAPGARGANQCASLMVTVLPLTGAFFLAGRRWEKLAMLPVAPFILNVILLCDSRGAFLSCFAMCGVLLFFAPRRVRKQILLLLGLGSIALYFLLDDPRIVERFMTTFTPAEERDSSAASRLDYWKAGLRMIGDYPLGAGGCGFKRVHGPKYIAEVNDQVYDARAVHNGYINEACEWGLQGLALRMLFIGAGFLLLWHAACRPLATDARQDLFARLLSMCLLAGLVGFLGTCMFGDRLDAEWGYWMVALAVAHARLYAAPAEGRAKRPATVAAPTPLSGRLSPAVPGRW